MTRRLRLLSLRVLVGLSSLAWLPGAAQAALPHTLTLREALDLAQQRQPALRQARAGAEQASAKARTAFAPLLPSVSLGLGYGRSTANTGGRPGGASPSEGASSPATLASYDSWSGNLAAQVTLWDFGQTWHRYQGAQSTAEAQAAQVRALEVNSALAVRTAWYAALASRSLVAVAGETLENTERHLAQVQGFVSAGARPEIDLAQSRVERANARLALVKAQGALAIAKARLQQQLGLDGVVGWDLELSEEGSAAQSGDDVSVLAELTPEALYAEAIAARPEAAALEAQLRAQTFSLEAVRGAFWPSLGASLGTSVGGSALTNLAPNVNGQLALTWALYQGGLTTSQEVESRAALAQLSAQRDALRLQVRLEVEQARLEVAAAEQALLVSEEARAATRERLRLADGRYQSGVGSSLERGDALLSDNAAAAQQVSAVYALATARAQLGAALGRR